MNNFHLGVLLATLCTMRMIILITTTVLLAGCTPPQSTTNAVESSSFEGDWYGIRPQGVTTLHSDSHFAANGDIEVRFFSCLSTEVEAQWSDRGTWVIENNLLKITLVSNAGDDKDGESYTRQYALLDDHYDRRAFQNLTNDYEFWLHRRWGDEPYDCTTTKADADSDREAAIADGRFNTVYPDYTGIDS